MYKKLQKWYFVLQKLPSKHVAQRTDETPPGGNCLSSHLTQPIICIVLVLYMDWSVLGFHELFITFIVYTDNVAYLFIKVLSLNIDIQNIDNSQSIWLYYLKYLHQL